MIPGYVMSFINSNPIHILPVSTPCCMQRHVILHHFDSTLSKHIMCICQNDIYIYQTETNHSWHGVLNKMTSILQATFSNLHFPERKFVKFDSECPIDNMSPWLPQANIWQLKCKWRNLEEYGYYTYHMNPLRTMKYTKLNKTMCIFYWIYCGCRLGTRLQQVRSCYQAMMTGKIHHKYWFLESIQ